MERFCTPTRLVALVTPILENGMWKISASDFAPPWNNLAHVCPESKWGAILKVVPTGQYLVRPIKESKENQTWLIAVVKRMGQEAAGQASHVTGQWDVLPYSCINEAELKTMKEGKERVITISRSAQHGQAGSSKGQGDGLEARASGSGRGSR